MLFEITETLIGLMAPILSFLAEEAYEFMPGEKLESVFLKDFPKANSKWAQPGLIADYVELLKVRSDVSKSLEELRQNKTIGANLDAEVVVTAEGPLLALLQGRAAELSSFFIVSRIELKNGPYSVQSKAARGTKCVRCWHWSEEIGKDANFPGICPKCVEALA